MATITKPKTWADNENVTYTDLNSSFDTIYNEFNGSIDNANIAPDAAIAESKLAFNTSTGHDHDGVNSKAIPKGMGWAITGTLTVSADPTSWLYINQAQTISKVVSIVKTAPTGASLIVDVEKSTDNGQTWTSLWATTTADRPTVAAGANEGVTTDFDTNTVAAGDYLRMAIDQVGSTVAGADLTVLLFT